MYRCNKCGKEFEDPERREYIGTYEEYYGVSSLFGDSNPCHFEWEVCPWCESESFDEIDEEDEEA